MPRPKRDWGAIRQFGPGGRWQARWPNPDTAKLTPAPETFATKAEATRWLAKKRTQLDAGTAVDDRAATKALSHWWPGYKRSLEMSSKKASTIANYEQAWRLRVEPRFGSVPVRRIKTSHVEEWLADLTATTSASKVIESHGVLKRVLDRAVRDGALAVNPCIGRRGSLPRRPTTEHPVLSPAEVEKLAQGTGKEAHALLIRVLAYGGLRIGEAFALRRRDVDLDRATVTVRESVAETNGHLEVGPTKTYAVRTITLPQALVEALRAHLDGAGADALVFANRQGAHRRYRAFRRDVWDKATTAAGIAATPHDLRATCASLLIDAGASVKDVQSHLGHADEITTLRLYTRVRPGRSADLAKRMDALLAEGTATAEEPRHHQ